MSITALIFLSMLMSVVLILVMRKDASLPGSAEGRYLCVWANVS